MWSLPITDFSCELPHRLCTSSDSFMIDSTSIMRSCQSHPISWWHSFAAGGVYQSLRYQCLPFTWGITHQDPWTEQCYHDTRVQQCVHSVHSFLCWKFPTWLPSKAFPIHESFQKVATNASLQWKASKACRQHFGPGKVSLSFFRIAITTMSMEVLDRTSHNASLW